MNYGELKRNIADVVKPNGNQEITGQIMQDALFALVENLGEGWQFGGAVHPSDEPSLGADVRAFYLAVEKGTYADFGGVEVTELTAIMYDEGWRVVPLGVAFGKDTEAEIGALADRVKALEADGSVTTDKIADEAVTEAKLSDSLKAAVGDNVKTVAQTLTDAQRRQARKNIDAAQGVEINLDAIEGVWDDTFSVMDFAYPSEEKIASTFDPKRKKVMDYIQNVLVDAGIMAEIEGEVLPLSNQYGYVFNLRFTAEMDGVTLTTKADLVSYYGTDALTPALLFHSPYNGGFLSLDEDVMSYGAHLSVNGAIFKDDTLDILTLFSTGAAMQVRDDIATAVWTENKMYKPLSLAEDIEITYTDEEKQVGRDRLGALSSADGAVATANIADNAVTSTKLAVGARNPIILTDSTTEVDEETYQKLLSDDVDVVFNGVECLAHTKNNNDIILIFGYSQFVTESGSSDGSIISYTVMISGTSPHKIQIAIGTVRPVLDSTLTPVLQEIDLTGTDAERKAKLDQFEKDWKALTGSNTLYGARFVGTIGQGQDVLLCFSDESTFAGICVYGDQTDEIAKVAGDSSTGSLAITPLFSHLEAVQLSNDSATNLTNIRTYLDNLNSLGVNTDKSPIIPFTYGNEGVVVGYIQHSYDNSYLGLYVDASMPENGFVIVTAKGNLSFTAVIDKATLNTELNEIKTPLKTSLEAITIYTDNTDEHKQANLDNIAAYEANLQALGVETTKSPMIPFIESTTGYQGFVQRTSDNRWIGSYFYSDTQTDYQTIQITEAGDVYLTQYASLLEVKDKVDKSLNAKSLEAITIKAGNTAADKAANVAAIKAYVDNLKALGVDVTKYPIMIPTSRGMGMYLGEDRDFGTIRTNGTNRLVREYVLTDGTYGSGVSIQDTTDYSLTTASKQIVGAINEVNALAKGVKALGAIEIKAAAADKAANKTAIDAYLKILTDAGIDTANGYSVPIRITGNSQEYFGTLNIGTGTLLSGVVTDINESHHYPCNVNISDGELTFSETNYFLEKTSNEVTEMLDAIKYSYTPVAFTETTLSNKAQLEVFLSKVPDAQVMNCTYKGIYAGTLHKINGDWFGLLVKNTNDYADNLNVKLQADGTLIEGTTSVQSINAQLDAINGEVK